MKTKIYISIIIILAGLSIFGWNRQQVLKVQRDYQVERLQKAVFYDSLKTIQMKTKIKETKTANDSLKAILNGLTELKDYSDIKYKDARESYIKEPKTSSCDSILYYCDQSIRLRDVEITNLRTMNASNEYLIELLDNEINNKANLINDLNAKLLNKANEYDQLNAKLAETEAKFKRARNGRNLIGIITGLGIAYLIFH